jgi:lipoprotein-anchoring transpeptidase ErfK/SrfK
MQRGQVVRGWSLAGLVLGILGTGLWALGCAASGPLPGLEVNLADGAAGVPIDSALTITARGANLDAASLERVDAAGPTPEFAVAPEAARLSGTLASDAQYHLVARAHVLSSAPRAPWQDPERGDLTLERVFSTVSAPRLVAPAEPIVAEKGEPLALRFSEPLARANVAATAPIEAQATIEAGDPRVLKVQLDRLMPGQQFALQLSSLVGRNGAPAADRTVTVQAPAGPDLRSVNGAAVVDRVTVPVDSPLTLEWSAPVRTLSYRVADEAETWSGAPTQRVELPLVLAPGETRTLSIVDARTADGGWLAEPRSIELSAPPPLKLAAVWPAPGAEGVTPGADPTFRFSEPVADRQAAEGAIRFDPPVAGKFEWLSPERVHFVPEGAFPSRTEVAVHVAGGPHGVVGASGSYLSEDVQLGFTTGKRKVIDVALASQRMTLYEDDVAVWSAPVATGVRGADTPPGTYKVEYKMPVARFRGVNPNGSRYDIPDVHWVMAFYGDYTIHGAYWRQNFGTPGSNGCISLTDPNAKHVFDWAQEGTIVRVHA